MVHTIDTSKKDLNWTAKGAERILQNVINLINTWRYEIAFNRTKGIDPAIQDKPLDGAIAEYTAEIYRVVSDHELRATVKEVQFTGLDNEGNFNFKVVVDI